MTQWLVAAEPDLALRSAICATFVCWLHNLLSIVHGGIPRMRYFPIGITAEANTVAIAAAGAIMPLVEMLRSPTEIVQAKAADALRMLAVDGAQCTL